MPPVSVFRHLASQSGTVAFRHRTRVPLFRYWTVRRSRFYKGTILKVAYLGCSLASMVLHSSVETSTTGTHKDLRIFLPIVEYLSESSIPTWRVGELMTL
jgi:hypothetical protein